MKKVNNVKSVIILLPLMVLICLITGVVVYRQINWGGDYAQYISQASAIVNGDIDKFILDNDFIIRNSSNLLGAVTYPWGLPCVLAIMMKMGLDSIFAFHMMEVLCVAGAGCILFYIGYDIFGLVGAVATSSLVFANTVFIKYSGIIATDTCFPLFVMLGVVAAYVLYYKGNQGLSRNIQKYVLLILVGVMTFLASAVRDGGVVLLIAVLMQQVLSCILQKKIIRNVFIEIAVVQCAYWVPKYVFDSVFPLQETAHYNMMFSASLTGMLQNSLGYLKCLWEIYPFPKPISGLFLCMTMVIVLVGLVEARKRCFYLPLLYAVGTYLLYCLWPVFIGIRFGFSAFMALLIYFPIGLKRISECDKSWIVKISKPILIVGVLAIWAMNSLYVLKYAVNPPELDIGPHTAEAEELFEYINSQTEKSDIIIFQKPRVVYLNTGRLGMQVDYKDFDEMMPMADYVIDGVEDELGDFDVYTLNQYDIENESIELSDVFANDKFTMYMIKK